MTAETPERRIYLDHNGSTPPTADVLSAIRDYLEGAFGNAGAAHPDGLAARSAIDGARAEVAGALGASDDDEIVFTSGGTESNNAAVTGLALAEIERVRATGATARRHVVCGLHEHPSVLRPVEALAHRGFEITWIELGPSGALDPGDVERALRDDTLFVCAMLANNETGILQPVVDVARHAHDRGALLFTDAVCGVGKTPVDVQQLGCDVLSVSGHKLHAPKGIGALWVRRGVPIQPWMLGCGQQSGLRSGTENTLGAVGLGAAMAAHAAPHAAERTQERLRSLRDHLVAGLLAIEGRRIERNGSGPDLANTCSMWFPGEDAADLQRRLGALGLSVSAPGTVLQPEATRPTTRPSHVLRAMGHDEQRATQSLRFSLGSPSTADEIDAALALVRRALQVAPLPTP